MVNRDAKARVFLEKAEILLDNGRERRAADAFKSAGVLYGELEEWKIAEQCFYYSSKTYAQLGGDKNFHRAALMQREAANCCVFLELFEKAQDYYNVAGKTILKSEAKEADEMATENFCFAFLCYFVRGNIEEGINYVKRFKSKISRQLYTDHILMHLVRKITNAYLKHKEAYIDEILDNFNQYKYGQAEQLLIKETLIVSLVAIMMDFSLNLKQDEVVRDEIFQIKTALNFDKLREFKNYTIVPRIFQDISITDTQINLGENISTKERPSFPIKLDLKNFTPLTIPFAFRANFPGKSIVGPIELSINIDGKYDFIVKSEKKPINITSPQAILGVNLNPLKTPVINQTFPLEVVVSNHSDGNAMEIEVEFEFPEELRLMRGTSKKTIYSLRPNEDIAWNIRVKAFDVGEIPIKTIVTFKDDDGESHGPYTAVMPLEINL